MTNLKFQNFSLFLWSCQVFFVCVKGGEFPECFSSNTSHLPPLLLILLCVISHTHFFIFFPFFLFSSFSLFFTLNFHINYFFFHFNILFVFLFLFFLTCHLPPYITTPSLPPLLNSFALLHPSAPPHLHLSPPLLPTPVKEKWVPHTPVILPS